MARGRLIAIEGLDGAGKSMLGGALRERLLERGERVELLREPGGVEMSERVRALVKDPALSISARAEALLYAAARAQLVHERVRPLLEENTLVLLDRYIDSSLAYQGAARELGVRQVLEINMFATDGLLPDRTLLLRISPSTRRARLRERGERPDRLELEDERFFAAIAAAYDRLAEEHPGRFRVIDAEPPFEQVLAQALIALEDLPVRPAS